MVMEQVLWDRDPWNREEESADDLGPAECVCPSLHPTLSMGYFTFLLRWKQPWSWSRQIWGRKSTPSLT